MSHPEHLGKYRIDGILGRGAMGVVYRGFDEIIGRSVALKTVRKELLTDEERAGVILRFKNEAKAAGRLIHPNIVAVFDYGEDAENAFIVMEYVSGQTLAKRLALPDPIPLAQTVTWMEQLLEAMDHAHFRGIIHRDIKPANVIVTSDDQIKLTDFGVARIESSSLTVMGSVIGTPHYMSPEQFLGETADARSDVFSAGVLLYQLLTRQLPFDGKLSAQIMQKILAEEAPRPSQFNPSLTRDFDEVVRKALEKKADCRHSSARAFMHGLHRAYSEWRVSQGLPMRPRVERPTVEAAKESPKHDGAAQPPAHLPGDGSSVFAPETLSFVQNSLASFVGPLAKLLLQRASTQAQSLDELCRIVAQHIPNAEGRSQFVQTVSQFQQRHHRTQPPATQISSGATALRRPHQATLGPATRVSLPLDEAALQRVEQTLSRYIGPIAKIMVKRAAAHCSNGADLWRTAAEAIQDQEQKKRFLAEAP